MLPHWSLGLSKLRLGQNGSRMAITILGDRVQTSTGKMSPGVVPMVAVPSSTDSLTWSRYRRVAFIASILHTEVSTIHLSCLTS